MFQYYLKIVPTLYQRRDLSTLSTNQFSVTKHKVYIFIFYCIEYYVKIQFKSPWMDILENKMYLILCCYFDSQE